MGGDLLECDVVANFFEHGGKPIRLYAGDISVFQI